MQTPSTRPSDQRPGPRRRLLPALGGGLVAIAAVTAVVVTTAGSSSASDPSGATGAPVSDGAPAAASVPAVAAASFAPTSTAPDPAAVAAAFAAVSNGTRSAVVTVPGGYEGADLTGGTTIRLWTSTNGTTWSQGGSSVYPPPFGSGDAASIKAAGLATGGAPHAVFVVDDQGSTGDGSGVDVAFSAGSVGFGAVKGAADGDLHPSPQGVGELGDIGTSYTADFQDGLLQTTECSTSVALADCSLPGTLIVKYWRWSGDAFVLDHRTGPAS